MDTKTISLQFSIPADMDTPSEVLARMRDLLLEALALRSDHFSSSEEDDCLIEALLTES